MADEISTRGLLDANIGPLRRFTGILDSYPTEVKHYDNEKPGAKGTTQISLNFKEIEVIEAVEPYHFPIFTLVIGQSNRKKSKFGVLSEGPTPGDNTYGLNNILDQQYTPEQLDPTNAEYVKPSDRPSIKDTLGKRWGLVMADGEEGRPPKPVLFDGRTNADAPTAAWTVYSIEGVGMAGESGLTPEEKAKQLLDGQTLAQFNKLALDSELVRGDTKLLQAISLPASAKNSFSSRMLAEKEFTKDAQNVFHRVKV